MHSDKSVSEPVVIDYEEHWSNSTDTYKSHPTSRHRRRFVMNQLRKLKPRQGMFVFDYGCGAGLLLEEIRKGFSLDDADLGGCDISHTGIGEATRRIPGGIFIAREFPAINREIDIAITSEVIEHTSEYRKVLEWLAQNLKPNGDLIITTPGGTMDPPDRYYGHIQHFTLDQLTSILRSLGFRIIVARDWGFPFFTLQKWVTYRNFERLRKRYMHGDLDFRKKAIFTLTYYAYYAHDIVSKGPQIFIHARKETSPLAAQAVR